MPSPECGGSGPFPPPSGFRRRSVPPAGTIRQSIGAGGHGAEAIPVPIPNTEVKLRSADDTGSVPGKQVAAGFFLPRVLPVVSPSLGMAFFLHSVPDSDAAYASLSGPVPIERLLDSVCDVVNQAFGFFPSKAWVCYGLAVDSLTDFLTAILDVTFNHESLYKFPDAFAVCARVQYVHDYPWLLERILL